MYESHNSTRYTEYQLEPDTPSLPIDEMTGGIRKMSKRTGKTATSCIQLKGGV